MTEYDRKRRTYFGVGLVAKKRNRTGCCGICDYNLTGLPEPKCPECGTGFER